MVSACLREFPHRHALRLEGIKGEAHVRIFVVDERAEYAGRQVAGFIPELLAGLVELLLHDWMAACCPSA